MLSDIAFFYSDYLTSLLTAAPRDLRVGVRWSLHVIKPSESKRGKRSECERVCSISRDNKAQLLLALHLLPVLKLNGLEPAQF